MNPKNSLLIAIDPGLRQMGWALFKGPRLKAVGLTRASKTEKNLMRIAEEHSSQLPDAHLAVVEQMLTYRRKGYALPSVMQLAHLAGYAAALYESAELVPTTTWKGGMSKEDHHAWLWENLPPADRKVLKKFLPDFPERLQHNILDAVGLGFWYVSQEEISG